MSTFIPTNFFEFTCLFLLMLSLVYQLYFHIFYIGKVGWHVGHSPKICIGEVDYPGVSVVICAKNESDNLEHYLHAILSQHYPLFEVIVIDDGSSDDTMQVLKKYRSQYDNLLLSFVPANSKISSTKKLGITLGVRESHYDFVLLTDADTCPQSPLWIKSVMDVFLQPGRKIDIVLGLSPYFVGATWLNGMITYDTLFNGSHYMGAALNGNPYMGVGRNIAYRKSFFYECDGFKSIMQYRFGDDDLFVNHFATSTNTGVALCADSLVWSVPQKTFKDWVIQKKRHLGISFHYRIKSLFRIMVEPISRGGVYLLSVLLMVKSHFEIQLLAFIVLLFYWILHFVTMNVLSIKVLRKKMGMGIILWNILLPVLNIVLLRKEKK